LYIIHPGPNLCSIQSLRARFLWLTVVLMKVCVFWIVMYFRLINSWTRCNIPEDSTLHTYLHWKFLENYLFMIRRPASKKLSNLFHKGPQRTVIMYYVFLLVLFHIEVEGANFLRSVWNSTPTTQHNNPKDWKFLVHTNFPSVLGTDMFSLYFIFIRQSWITLWRRLGASDMNVFLSRQVLHTLCISSMEQNIPLHLLSTQVTFFFFPSVLLK
jgi:hypothetical protein